MIVARAGAAFLILRLSAMRLVLFFCVHVQIRARRRRRHRRRRVRLGPLV